MKQQQQKNVHPLLVLFYTKFDNIIIDIYVLKYIIYFDKAYLRNTL